ncbi:MAG TPA: lipopolysaccharide assembly protein LapA domain-containing protein [Gammaproteobacteria bacterium]|nr:lipopolysaccharide assembly protein LapA domain-containing protein [Gammaproteobacteria bacterium]
MTLLRKIVIVAILALFVFIAAVFAWNNPEPVDLDLGFAIFEGVSLTLILACAFALGWLFGLGCVGFAILRMSAERRRMRRELRDAHDEVASLRSLPIGDAD